jgi:hypothetical protein
MVPEGFEWALPIDVEDNLRLGQTFGKPQGPSWKPVQMKLLKKGRRKWKPADTPWMASFLMVLKPKAVEALRDMCLAAGELLPFACDDAELVAWNVTNVVDALDLEKSTVVRYPDGGIMQIKKYFFKPDVIADLEAFRIPEDLTIFVGQAFVDRARSAGLEGAAFRELWPHG